MVKYLLYRGFLPPCTEGFQSFYKGYGDPGKIVILYSACGELEPRKCKPVSEKAQTEHNSAELYSQVQEIVMLDDHEQDIPAQECQDDIEQTILGQCWWTGSANTNRTHNWFVLFIYLLFILIVLLCNLNHN